MKCQICKNNESTVQFKQVHNDKVKELSVCLDCAKKNGFIVQSPMSMTDFLFGVGGQTDMDLACEDKACPACGMKLSRMRKNSRLGCAICYESFTEELMPFLEAMQKGVQHTGKVPEGDWASDEMLSLQKAMDEAVALQHFEEAALLRDRISELKSGINTVKDC